MSPEIHLKEHLFHRKSISFDSHSTDKHGKMKVLIVFAVVLSVGYVHSAMTEEEMMKMFMVRADECKGKEGASDDDIAPMLAKKPPTTHEGKCVLACIGEKDGIVSFL